MDAIYKMAMLPSRTPEEIVKYIYANAVNWQNNRVAWLEIADEEVIIRIWYFRNYSVRGRQETRYTECVRKISGDSRIIWKNGYWHGGMSESFQPVYLQKDVKRWCYGYEEYSFREENFDKWNESKIDLFDMCVPVLNLQILSQTKYKYCAYPRNCDLMRYLKIYDKDPSVEFFGKCGLYPCPSLVKLAKTDKSFCRFLRENAAEIDLYGPQATIYAYKNKVDVVEARRICEKKARIDRQVREYIPEVKGTCIDRKKLYEYLEGRKKKDGFYQLRSSYNDYLKAVKGLRLDLKDTKNVYPNDFQRMHDLRIDEFAALEAKRDREKRKKLYNDFAKKARELKRFEWTNGEYSIIIPGDISDLIHEGEVLKHCVGKMGYDLKVIKGTSIIAFLRKTESKETPFCTIEYRLDLGKLAQCYIEHDRRPEKEVCDYAEAWSEYVKTIIEGEKDNGKRIRSQVAARQGAGA